MKRYHPIRLTKITGLRERWGVAYLVDSNLGGRLFLRLEPDEQRYYSEGAAEARCKILEVKELEAELC